MQLYLTEYIADNDVDNTGLTLADNNRTTTVIQQGQ